MKKQFNKLAGILICITFAVFLLFIKDKVDVIWAVICNFATILTPFIYAFGIAYVLNFPYSFFSTKVFSKIKAKWFQKFIKPLSLLTTYVLVLGLISFMFASLIPQLLENVSGLFKEMPSYFKAFRSNTETLIQWLGMHGIDLSGINDFNKYLADELLKIMKIENVGNLSSIVINTGMFFYNWILGFILSVYMIASKDFLLRQVKRFAVAFFPTMWLPRLYEIIDVTDDKCGKFLVGKILDSTIIGIMCFIAMSIMHLPYALLISVIVAVCNIIPFFGPFIGGIPSALILLVISPGYCLAFVLMIVILQQIDGNFIGPKIVGSQVGLVGFWSLFSVLIAGGLFGVAGMILGTPIFAAIYTLTGRLVKKRIKMKGDNAQEVLAMSVVNPTNLTNLKAKKLKKQPEDEIEPENGADDEASDIEASKE